jgi:hypothetical protein
MKGSCLIESLFCSLLCQSTCGGRRGAFPEVYVEVLRQRIDDLLGLDVVVDVKLVSVGLRCHSNSLGLCLLLEGPESVHGGSSHLCGGSSHICEFEVVGGAVMFKV